MKETTGDSLRQRLISIRDSLHGPEEDSGDGDGFQTIDFDDMRQSLEKAVERLDRLESCSGEIQAARQWFTGRISGLRRVAALLFHDAKRDTDTIALMEKPVPELISALQEATERLRRNVTGSAAGLRPVSGRTKDYNDYKC